MTSEELSQCLDSCGDNVYGFCIYLTGNRVKADDLYQDTFLTALEKADRISVNDNPESYLMGIALRLWKNHERKNARRMRIAGSDSLEERQERTGMAENTTGITDRSAEDMYLEQDMNRKLKELVLQLKPAYRIPVSLYYAGEKSVKEIADIMKLPQGTVKRRLFHARKILREMME
nr:RNA polymerase sigma factor [Lachnospiraceae bacterium]